MASAYALPQPDKACATINKWPFIYAGGSTINNNQTSSSRSAQMICSTVTQEAKQFVIPCAYACSALASAVHSPRAQTDKEARKDAEAK
jgi:hypothetical protein